MEQVLKNADISRLSNFVVIFFQTLFDIEKFYQVLSTCQISDQLGHSNRNYRGGGTKSALPQPYQCAKSLTCLGSIELKIVITSPAIKKLEGRYNPDFHSRISLVAEKIFAQETV